MGYLTGKAHWKKQLQIDVNANVALIDQENTRARDGGDGGMARHGDVKPASSRMAGGPLVDWTRRPSSFAFGR